MRENEDLRSRLIQSGTERDMLMQQLQDVRDRDKEGDCQACRFIGWKWKFVITVCIVLSDHCSQCAELLRQQSEDIKGIQSSLTHLNKEVLSLHKDKRKGGGVVVWR